MYIVLRFSYKIVCMCVWVCNVHVVIWHWHLSRCCRCWTYSEGLRRQLLIRTLTPSKALPSLDAHQGRRDEGYLLCDNCGSWDQSLVWELAIRLKSRHAHTLILHCCNRSNIIKNYAVAISSNFNDSFCVLRFSCCSSCLWHHQYSRHVSCSEELVLVNNWMPIQEKEEHECFSEATLLFYNGQPAPHNHSHSDGNMEVGGLPQTHCTCLKLHKWSPLVQVGQFGGEIWGSKVLWTRRWVLS